MHEVYLLLLTAMNGALRRSRTLSTKPRSSDWWERIVLETSSDSDWRENFRMSCATYVYICNKLRCRLVRQDTNLFGISKASVCYFVKEVSQAVVDVLMPRYIKVPEGHHLK